MESKQLSLTHLVQYPAAHTGDSGSKYATILTLDGRGRNERDPIVRVVYLPNHLLWIRLPATFAMAAGVEPGEFSMGHPVTAESLEGISLWLEKQRRK